MIDGTTFDYKDTLSNELGHSSPIDRSGYSVPQARIREGKRRAPSLAEEAVVAPVEWWLPEETLEEARARVDETMESEARFAIFEDMPSLDFLRPPLESTQMGRVGKRKTVNIVAGRSL